MLHEAPFAHVAGQVAQLNATFRARQPLDILRHALTHPSFGQAALVSSFGAESVVLLHMVAKVAPATPILFLDTEMLFSETLAYQSQVAEHLGLTNVRIVKPDMNEAAKADAHRLLHISDPDACCALRKVRPLQRALEGFDGWITGRKRFHGAAREDLVFFEADGARIKINPLAGLTRADISTYIEKHDLPRHPLVAQGFASIGCAPCTVQTRANEDTRTGRWKDSPKTECGIHFLNHGPINGPGQKGDHR